MLLFTRIHRLLLIPMAFFLPFWLTFGRALLGSGGWGSLIYLMIIAPVLLVALLVLGALVKIRKDGTGKTRLGITDSAVLTVLYASLLLHGIFFVDAGDTQESMHSVATRALGQSFIPASDILSSVFANVAILTLAVAAIVFIYERTKRQLP